MALLCVAPPAFAADSVCPGADAWAAAHPEESDAARTQRDAARSLTHPDLRRELAERFARDQEARIAMLAGSRGAGRAAGAIDEDNLRWLHALVRAQDFPTVAQVGEQGVLHAWLLAQHADRAPTFQAALLPVIERRAQQGELPLSDFARFTDRVLKAQGKPQRYGTQFPPQEWARPHFGLPDAASVQFVEENRRALGIMPLADYVCMMSEARR
ncbi:DUF6624 domain-containing protein [Massilia sp. Leaf139]|uniref:DUF6624 domain-containing protein n=1 Tax=Massilia sp. Leaf139 TaxID=1736272 RepID=UPI0006F96615|nr:DUF6624 domain-containing protein [Massilia sp. Leaf139]KQQ92013.1 hypothetical protein ASF77_08825 [Massilia sp. Leaf139]